MTNLQLSPIETKTLLAAIGDKPITGIKQADHSNLRQKLEHHLSLVNKNNDDRITLLSSQIKDWRLGEDKTINDLKPEQRKQYSIELKQRPDTCQLEFMITNSCLLNPNLSGVTPLGMSGVIEIRDGYPAISLGINSDENILHVVSDGYSKLSVIPELNDDQLFWEPIQITEQKHNGLSLDVGDSYSEELNDSQRLVAQHELEHYDFKPLVVKDLGNWECNDNVWTIPVYLESDDEEMESSDKINFTVTFFDNSSNIKSIEELNV